MSDDPKIPAPDLRSRPEAGAALGAATMTSEWLVGDRKVAPSGRDAAARRIARLEARLAVYAQYAAVVAEQAAATLAGETGRADTLARERVAVAEHFGELQTSPIPDPESGRPAAVPPFDALLGDALAELEHQAAVHVALRQRLVGLRDAVVRGAAWASGAAPAAGPGAAGDGTGVTGSAPTGAPTGATGDTTGPSAGLALLPGTSAPALEGGLLAARAAGVGPPRHAPGLASGIAALPAVEGVEGSGGGPGTPRLDLRF